MELPKIVPVFTEAKVSPSGKINIEDIKKILKNLVLFTLPASIAFFSLLSQGVDIHKAWPVALLVLWGIVADYLKKLNDGKN